MLLKKEYKMIKLDDLESMADYQRPLDMDFVEEKSKSGVFDKNAVECPKISVRNDGTMKIGDGQHTVAIVRKAGWTSIRCELRYGLTVEEENDWFTQENTKRRPQNSKRILTARINGTYENNKEEKDFYTSIKLLGFKLDIIGEEPGADFKIGCPANLLNVFKEYYSKNKIKEFSECMSIIKYCFNGDPYSLKWNFIRGMFDFYETYQNEMDLKRLIKTLLKHSAEEIKKETDSDKYTKKASLKYAKFFVYEYNNGLAKSKRLKMSKLEE